MDQLLNPPPRLSAAQRHFLLQTMGIQRYCLRSADAALPPEEAAALPLPPVLPEADPSPLLPLQAPEDHAGTGPVRPPVAPASSSIAAPPPVLSAVAFQILLLQTDRRLAVCVALPQRPQTVLERNELQLLRNLLQWLGCRLPAEAAARPFVWPLPGLVAVDAGPAGQALSGFLTQAQQELGFSRLLVLGDHNLEVLEPQLVAADAGWQGWYTKGLADMLARPALKREVYQRLQTLHAGLSG